MNKKLTYGIFALALTLSACSKNDDKKSSDTKKKGVDGYQMLLDLKNKNPESALTKIVEQIERGESLDLAMLETSMPSSKTSIKFLVDDFAFPDGAFEDIGKFGVIKLDLGFDAEVVQDAGKNMSLKAKVANSKSLDALLKDIFSSEIGKVATGMSPELKNLSVSKMNLDLVSSEAKSYMQSDMVDTIFPTLKNVWIELDESTKNTLPGDFNSEEMSLDGFFGNKELAKFVSYRYYGEEKVDGTKTGHYEIFLDFEKAKKEQDKDLVNLSKDELKTLKDGLKVSAEVWVSETFELMKMKMKMNMNLDEDLSNVMNVMNKIGVEDKGVSTINELEGLKMTLEISTESYKDAKVELPTEFMTMEEFMKEVQNSSLGALLKI
ncbi:MAG: hypothetical protein Fur0024_4360 [Patescibacteria group bacterium]